MLLTPQIPRTKASLVQLLQRQNIQQIEILEPYDQSMDVEIKAKLKTMSQRPGEVAVIMLRTT
jgi:hypothetical protein